MELGLQELALHKVINVFIKIIVKDHSALTMGVSVHKGSLVEDTLIAYYKVSTNIRSTSFVVIDSWLEDESAPVVWLAIL